MIKFLGLLIFYAVVAFFISGIGYIICDIPIEDTFFTVFIIVTLLFSVIVILIIGSEGESIISSKKQNK